MKNLPEKDFWNALKVRLNNYSESPDDDGWDRIAGALPKSKSPSLGKRWTGIVLIFLLGTITGYLVNQYTPLTRDTNASFVGAVSPDGNSTDESRSSETPAGPMKKSDGAVLKTEAPPPPIDAARNGKQHTGNESQTRSSKNENVSQPKAPALKKSPLSNRARNQKEYTDPETQHGITSTNGDAFSHTSNMSANTIIESKVTNVSNTNSEISDLHTTQSDVIAVNSEETVGDHKSSTETRSIHEQSPVSVDSAIVDEPEIIAQVASGQSEKKDKKEKKEKRIFHADVYANITPSLSFQKITPSGNDDLRIIGLQSNGVMSGDRFGISLEAGFQRKLTPRLDFYVGLSYYRQRQTLTYEYNGSGVTVDQGGKNGEYSITPMKESKSFQYSMTNAGISSGVMYHLFGEKLMHKVGGGLQFQKGLMQMGSEGSYKNAESFYLSYQLSYRLECQLNSKWNVYLQPTFIHSVIAHEELNEPFTIKPYRAGLGVGVIYHF
jgi:hypothetical protein